MCVCVCVCVCLCVERNSLSFMAPEGLLPCSQKLATSPCSVEPDEYNRKSETLYNIA